MLSAPLYDKTDGGTILGGRATKLSRFAPAGPMPILIAKPTPPATPDPGRAFMPIDFQPHVLCAPGWTGPDCKTPIDAAPTASGGTPVITQPVEQIPSTPDEIPWWKRIATAIVPQSDRNGSFGPGGGFGPSFPPSASAAGDVEQAGATTMQAGAIPPELQKIAMIGLGLFLLSKVMK